MNIDKALAIGQSLKVPLTAENFSQDGSKAGDEVFVPLHHILQEKENRYGKVLGKIKAIPEMLEDGTFYLTEVDDKMRRKYQQIKLPESKGIAKKDISSMTAIERIENIDHQIASGEHFSGLYKLSIPKRV